MNFSALDLTWVALTGGAVGFLSGLFGIGGGFLLVPVLNIALGIPMEFAVGAGACQVLGPATTSLLARRVSFRHARLPLTIFGGLLVGVCLGAELFELAKRQNDVPFAHRDVPFAELVVLGTYFVLMLSVGLFALWEARIARTEGKLVAGWLAHLRIPPFTKFSEFGPSDVSITVLSWFGLAVGFLAGLLGMSGGLILLPGLIYLLGMRTHQAVLSSLMIVWIVALQSTVAHAWHNNVNLTLVMALLFGGTVGARLGSELSQKLGGRQLRQSLGWLLLIAAVLVGLRLLRLTLA